MPFRQGQPMIVYVDLLLNSYNPARINRSPTLFISSQPITEARPH